MTEHSNKKKDIHDQQTIGLHKCSKHWPIFVNQPETWTLSWLIAEDYGVSTGVWGNN